MDQAREQFEQIGQSTFDRRDFLRLGGAVGVGALLSSCKQSPTAAPSAPATQPVAATSPPESDLVRFPEKTELILLTERPPQLETPIQYFREDLTPNEAFFVRWHLAGIPVSVDTKTFRLAVKGHVGQELSLSLDDLRQQFEPVSTIAVNQCSGNSRSLFEPRVPGGQWGNGAVGNALWTGVRLKDVLEKANVKDNPVEVSVRGLETPVLPTTPAFVTSRAFERANDGEVMIAYEMNNRPLPMLNGFPIRLIVPGWYATYWVKALSEINVLAEPFKGFWMDKAYRVAVTPDFSEAPDHLAEKTTPISWMTVRSILVKPEIGDRLKVNEPYEIEGIAMDSGKGITKVEVSTDDAKTWADAQLDPELGKYSWRRFRFTWTPAAKGALQIMARATNAAGETQVTEQWNRSGYARNVIDAIDVTVA